MKEGKGSFLSLDDLDFVAFGIAEADDLTTADGDDGLEKEFDADGFQFGISGVEIGHADGKVPKALAEPGNFNRGRTTGVFDRHQFKRGTDAEIVAVAKEKAGRFLAVIADDFHAHVFAVPRGKLANVVATDGGMVDGGVKHNLQS
jgi:hypothetical protein